MKAFNLLLLFFILGNASCLTLSEKYNQLTEEINPLFVPMLVPSTGPGSEPNEGVTTEALINQVLLNNKEDQRFLWAELVKGTTIYEFFFDGVWDPAVSEEPSVARKVSKAFHQYQEIGGDEAKCRAITSKDMAHYERQFRNKLVNFMAGLVEFSKKSLLYQLLPNGKFRPIDPSTFRALHDLNKAARLLIEGVAPFINCLQIHTQITVEEEPEGFFVRFWNWIRSLFGFEPKKRENQYSLDESVDPIFKKELQPDGSSLGGQEFKTKTEEYEAIILSLGSHGAQNLENYLNNLKHVARLMDDPMPEVTKTLYALLLRFRAEQNYDIKAWEDQATPLLLYNLLLNCNDDQNACRLNLRKDAQDHFMEQTKFFIDAFLDDESVDSERLREYQIFIQQAFGVFLNGQLLIGTDFAARALKSFWGILVPQPYPNSIVDRETASEFLESKAPATPYAMSNARVYPLAHEILALLPEGKSLKNPEWFGMFVSVYSDCVQIFNLDVLKISRHSKLMIGEPFGTEPIAQEYYAVLSALVSQCLLESPPNEADFSDFSKHFDSFLDHHFGGKSTGEQYKDVAKFYPLLKIHNLWAVDDESVLKGIKFQVSTAEQKSTWTDLFLQGSKSPKLARILTRMAAAVVAEPLNDLNEVWTRLATLTFEQLNDFNSSVRWIYSPPRIELEAENIVRII